MNVFEPGWCIGVHMSYAHTALGLGWVFALLCFSLSALSLHTPNDEMAGAFVGKGIAICRLLNMARCSAGRPSCPVLLHLCVCGGG